MSTADEFLQRHPELLDEDRTSEAALRWNARFATLLAAYFRFRISGWSHLPDGPCLIVANHGVGSPFVLPLLARAWHRALGPRPVRGLMHRLGWERASQPLGRALRSLGGIFAHPAVAARALARGQSLLVFPGGDVDAMRPFADRYRVDFGGRCGFVRLARKTGVPILPLAICGSQTAYITLGGAERVGRILGLHRAVGLHRFPVTVGAVALAASLALPPLWPLAPLALLQAVTPLPTRIEARFLAPTRVGDAEGDEEAAERIRISLERELEAMAARRWSFLG